MIYFKQEAENNANELYIFGDITNDQYYEEDTSPVSLKKQLADLSGPLDVFIDSYGGSVSAGWALYNLLREYGKKQNAAVTTHGMGFVASAALYPFMAGSRRVAHTPSGYFFHNASAVAVGYPSDLRKAADETQKITEIGMAAFTDNTSLTRDDIQALMDAETWLSPQEAFDKGIATAILTETASGAAEQSAKGLILQRLFRQSAPTIAPKIENTREPAPIKNLSNLKRLRNLYKNR